MDAKAPEIIDDAMKPIREYCTCPACQVVWAHKEWGTYGDNDREAKRRYGERVTCPECGAASEPATKENAKWWRRMFTDWRVLVKEPVKTPDPFTERQQAEEGRDR